MPAPANCFFQERRFRHAQLAAVFLEGDPVLRLPERKGDLLVRLPFPLHGILLLHDLG